MLCVSGILILSGCGTGSFKMVNTEAVKPAAPMGLSTDDAGLELSVTALVVYDGPGSWKQHAYWDEYVVRFVNHRAEPVKVEIIELADVLDRWVPLAWIPGLWKKPAPSMRSI